MNSDPHPVPTEGQQRLVRCAARALGRHRLVHAYGHCSLRLDEEFMLVCPPVPMGLVGMDHPATIAPIRGSLPAGVLGEVRLHQQIYGDRPSVQGVCRTMPPNLMTLSVMRRVPVPRHGLGAYFWPQPGLWDDMQLIREDERARAAVALMRDTNALVMRGNGVVVCAETLQRAVILTWYLEDAARIELELLRCGMDNAGSSITEAEAKQRAVWDGGIEERMWQFLVQGDPESASLA